MTASEAPLAGVRLTDVLCGPGDNMEKRTVYFTMVLHPANGWTRVGNAYPTRKAASEWLSFVRGAWRGLRAKVSQCTLLLKDGKICEKSRRVLDAKYNLDA